MSSLSQISFKTADGQNTSLKNFEGKVLLIVNVASKCGLTPQYDALEAIYEKYQDQGFSVLAFPANEFGAQEPGSNAEIQEFCRMNFGVKFPVLEKIVVKGEGQHPLYKTLTQEQPVALKKQDSSLVGYLEKHGLLGKPSEIMWNFEKFLVNKKGEVVKRFAPDIEPNSQEVIEAIESEIKK